MTIKQALELWAANRPPKTYDGKLSPSMLGGCPRVHYWKLKGIEPTTPPDYGSILNFQVGFMWEELAEKALAKVEHDFQLPVEIPDLNIAGTLDFLIDSVIHDTKTVGSWVVDKDRKGQYEWERECKGYIIQQGCYILGARLSGKFVKHAVLDFICKDDGNVIKELEVHLTPELENLIKTRANYLNNCLKNDELPACECDGWKMSYCDYGDPKNRKENWKGKLINTNCCKTRFLKGVNNG